MIPHVGVAFDVWAQSICIVQRSRSAPINDSAGTLAPGYLELRSCGDTITGFC